MKTPSLPYRYGTLLTWSAWLRVSVALLLTAFLLLITYWAAV